ncbi:uncharacterized protein [Palaemon carinicauda]|uniref:uncharacterized protein n=1 Tax=Palaemon carinicauda TaxID=392227 RepID=UPI0035B59766
MVERFHRTLKVALMSCCKDSYWFNQLLWVFLRQSTTPKHILDVLAAEMVYGNQLVVPAEFSVYNLVQQSPVPDLQAPAKQHIPTDLHSVTHVLLLNKTSKPPLMHPYTGRFLVIRRTPKAFLLNMRGKEDWFYIDRLKPAYLVPYNPITIPYTLFLKHLSHNLLGILS